MLCDTIFVADVDAKSIFMVCTSGSYCLHMPTQNNFCMSKKLLCRQIYFLEINVNTSYENVFCDLFSGQNITREFV